MTLGLLFALVFMLGWIPVFVYRTEELTQALPSYRGAERLWLFVTPALLAIHCTLGVRRFELRGRDSVVGGRHRAWRCTGPRRCSGCGGVP